MSIWSKFIGIIKNEDTREVIDTGTGSKPRDARNYAFIDTEVGLNDYKIHDIGSLRHDDAVLHEPSVDELLEFLDGVDYVCGHNIIHHDARYVFANRACQWVLVDSSICRLCSSPSDHITGS